MDSKLVNDRTLSLAYVFREIQSFMSSSTSEKQCRGVCAIMCPFCELPAMTDMSITEVEGCIVYDGTLSSYELIVL